MLGEHLKEKFSNFDVADILQILALTALVLFVLLYTKSRNARTFSYILIVYYVLICGLCALGVYPSVVLVALFLAPVLLLALLFGQELKRDIFKISWKSYSASLFNKAFVDPDEIKATIANIVKAAQSLSKKDTGALIVIVPDKIGEHILESGTYLNADVSAALLENIFMKHAPLHDGAVIIKGNKILAAGCYLPLSQATNIPKELGTRHRSAAGVTETNPSVTAIVVSEETGIISALHDGRMMRYLDAEKLENALRFAYLLDENKSIWGADIDEEEHE